MQPDVDRIELPERLFNVALALSFVGWAVKGLQQGHGLVRISIACLNLVIAGLVLLRTPERGSAEPRQILRALPALLVAGLSFSMAPDPGRWHWSLQLLLAAGAAQAIWSLISLGRSFAVLPARRELVSRGPYRWVRHPAYLGELVMVSACAMAAGWQALWAPLVLLPLVVMRVRAEEQVLAQDGLWSAYVERVKFRLFPGIW